MPDSPRKVYIELDQIGCGKVIVDGVDVSNYVSGVQVCARVGRLTEITLAIAEHALAVEVEARLKVIIQKAQDADR